MPLSKTARRDKVEIYLHLMWTTRDREPLISPEWEEELFAVMHEMLERHRCGLVASGGVEDHVHLLITFHATTCLSDLMKDLKGTSSRFAGGRVDNFKWRPTYAAFSVSRWDVRKIKKYILNQKEHHAQGTFKDALECCGEVYFYDDWDDESE